MSTSIPCRHVLLTKVHEPGVTCTLPNCTGEQCAMKSWRYSLTDGTPIDWKDLQAGDVYVEEAHAPTSTAAREYGCPWDDCDGQHMRCILPPDNHPWLIDGRASNCTMPSDRLHRCWVRHGDPAVPGTLHVDKNGVTCNAGAGSIAVVGYHGVLHDGCLIPC